MTRVVRQRLLTLGCLFLLAAGAGGAESFYIGLMEMGSRDYLRGDYPTAAKKLEIACFGLLDDPQLLTRGLIRLALAQAGAGNDRGFNATVDRLLEVESRFGSYSGLSAETTFKIEFERLLAQRYSADALDAIPAFSAVAARMRQADLTALPPKRLRKELERRLAANPRDSEALVLLTRLDIAQDREPRAEARLAGILAADAEHRMARCLHGQIKLRRDDCAGAMEDLSWCSRPPADEVLGAHYLRCLVAAADWQAAGSFLASLPLALRSREEVANLILTIPPETLETLARAPGAEVGAVPQAEPALAADEVGELRDRLAAVTGRGELDELFARVAERAGQRPEDGELQHLAAEVAYRRADYATAVDFFRRGGVPGPGRPLLSFYLAVSLFEIGQTEEAARVLEAALPMLESTPFVERYRRLILDPAAAG